MTPAELLSTIGGKASAPPLRPAVVQRADLPDTADMGLGHNSHVAAYDAQADTLAAEYEALDPSGHRETFAALLPAGEGRLALDVGAGSGRDANWLVGHCQT